MFKLFISWLLSIALRVLPTQVTFTESVKKRGRLLRLEDMLIDRSGHWRRWKQNVDNAIELQGYTQAFFMYTRLGIAIRSWASSPTLHSEQDFRQGYEQCADEILVAMVMYTDDLTPDKLVELQVIQSDWVSQAKQWVDEATGDIPFEIGEE
jgi:hypothetical protein